MAYNPDVAETTNTGEPAKGRMALPSPLQSYFKEPRQTWGKVNALVNARWQLRHCTRVGRFTRLKGRIFVDNLGQILIGDRVFFLSHYAHSVLATLPGGRLEIGNRTFVNYGVDITAAELVKIGADCLIGTHVMMMDTNFHGVSQRDQVANPRPIILEDNVWIGNRAIILPGVHIGEGAVIGAGSVVRSAVPARALVIGNPAQIVKTI